MALTQQEEDQLRNNSENYSHNHPNDRILTYSSLSQLQNLASVRTVSATYFVSYTDDFIQCDNTCTITLPPSKGGKEFVIVLIHSGKTMTIATTGTDKVKGGASVSTSTQWTSFRFKSISGGYLLI